MKLIINKFLFFLIPDLSCKIFIPRTSQNDHRPCFLDHTPIIPGRRSKGENPGKEFKHPHDFLVSCVTSFPTVLSLKNVSDFVGLRYFLIGIFRNLIKISNQLSEKHDEMLGEILHLFINWDTVKKIQLRNKRLKSKLRGKYVLNLVNEPQQFATIKRLRNYLKSTSVF